MFHNAAHEYSLTQLRGIITCALRFSVFFTVPLFSDPTWYASGGPMIYALVEPSIYMIASILPTTRHLYRRARRNWRQAHQRSTNESRTPKTSRVSDSAELDDIEHSDHSNRGITRRLDIWQANTHSSQEELTLGEWYQSGQEWNQPKASDGSSRGAPDAHSSASGDLSHA